MIFVERELCFYQMGKIIKAAILKCKKIIWQMRVVHMIKGYYMFLTKSRKPEVAVMMLQYSIGLK